MCNKIARQAEEKNLIAITWCISLNILIGPMVLSIVYYLRYHQAIIGYLSVLKGWETVTFFVKYYSSKSDICPCVAIL